MAHEEANKYTDIAVLVAKYRSLGYSDYYYDGSYNQGYIDIVMSKGKDKVIISWKR